MAQRADEDVAATLQARAQAQIDAAKATKAAGSTGEGRQGGADGSASGEAGERPPPPSPEQVAAEKAKQKQAVAGAVSPPETSGAKSEAASAAAGAKDEAAKPPTPAAGGGAGDPAPAPQAADADASEVAAAAQQATQAATAAAAEVTPDEPAAVQPPEPLQTVNAGGREIPADPVMEAGISALGVRLQALRAGAHQVRTAASAERGQGHRLESLLHAGRGAVADAALAITALKGHNEHRRSVVQQAKGALDVSAQKAEMVASGAPGVSAKSDEGAQKSGPMAAGSKDLAAENAAKTPEDAEAAGKSGEQGSKLTQVGSDMGSIDTTIGQTKARAGQLAADAAHAKQANTQSQGQIAAAEQAIAQAEDKAGQLSEQNEAARGQLEGYAAEPAAHRAAADELVGQGQALHDASTQLEARLAAAQQAYIGGMAATPPPVPARRGRSLQRDAYEGRTAYHPDAAATAALPSWLSGEDPPRAKDAAAHKTQEDSRRAAELAEIDQEAGGHFERLSASQKAGIALRLTGRNLWKGIGDTNLPKFGLTILRGFVDPRVSLMGIVHGLGSIASGVANLFSAEQWEKDPLGNALKSAADIATGVTIVLGSIAGLAVAIGVILTAIAIIGSIFSFGAVGAALAPIIVFCGTVATTVGPWAIEAAAVALVLHALVFIKNLIDAATADTANQLEQSSEQMTEDAQNAGSMAMQIGMAKAMEAGGELLGGGGGAEPEPAAAAGEGAGATPDLAAGPEPAGAPAGEGGAAPEEAPAAPAPAEPGKVDLSGEAANDNARSSPLDFPGEPANDNALPGPEAAEQVLAATGTDGPVDVGPVGPRLQVIEGGAGSEGAPRAMAGEGPAGGSAEPSSTATAPETTAAPEQGTAPEQVTGPEEAGGEKTETTEPPAFQEPPQLESGPEQPTGRPAPAAPVDAPRAPDGSIDFEAWEERLRDKGVGGDLEARLARARAGDADAIAELRTAERYADAGYRTDLAVPQENAGVRNPDIDAQFSDTTPPADQPLKVEVKSRTENPMTRSSLNSSIDAANDQIRQAGPGGGRGDIVIDASEAPSQMTSEDIGNRLRGKMRGAPGEPGARLRSIDYLEVVYRDPADGLLKRTFMVRTADGVVNGPFTETFPGQQ